MRIIAGKLRGRKLPELKRVDLRPTTDFAKEALFNILQNKLNWDTCLALDLFSGTGSVGLEMISRGCKQLVSVEQSPKAIAYQKENAANFGVIEQIEFVHKDVLSFLNANKPGLFHLIFADPPFDSNFEFYLELMELIRNKQWLTDQGLLVLEHNADKDFSAVPYFIEHRRYGAVHFSFFQKTTD